MRRAVAGEVARVELRLRLRESVLVEVRRRADPVRVVDLEELEERDLEAIMGAQHELAQDEVLAADRDVDAVEAVEQVEGESE